MSYHKCQHNSSAGFEISALKLMIYWMLSEVALENPGTTLFADAGEMKMYPAAT